MRISLEERACNLAVYIIEEQCTVHAAAKKSGVSKSTVHMDVHLASTSSSLYMAI